jgi:hypothetical protein
MVAGAPWEKVRRKGKLWSQLALSEGRTKKGVPQGRRTNRHGIVTKTHSKGTKTELEEGQG